VASEHVVDRLVLGEGRAMASLRNLAIAILACTFSSGGLNVAADGGLNVAADRPVVGLPDDLEEALGAFLEVRRDPRVQLEAATQAARAFLEALGVELTSAGMADTPSRMARAYAELLSSRPFVATHFSNDDKYDQMVLAKGIPFRSVCEHHMLPFTGLVYLGYLPGERILGLSKLARLVEHFARSTQMQERLTRQIAE
jgi:hypothetical protein